MISINTTEVNYRVVTPLYSGGENQCQVYSDYEMWTYLLANGMIDKQQIQANMDMMKRKELLEKHPFSIWRGSDGKWYTYIPDKVRGGIRKKRNTQKEIEDIVAEYWRQQIDNPTLLEVFNGWNDRRLEFQKISKATHEKNICTFKRHYSGIQNRKIKTIVPEYLCDFLERQIPEHQLGAKAFANLKGITKGFFKYAKTNNLIDFYIEDVFKDLDTSDRDFKKVIKEDYQEVYNDEEMEVMIRYLLGNMDLKNLGILLMFVTGMRIGELVTLKNSDFVGNTVKIRRTETRYRDLETGKYVYAVKEFPKSEAGVRDPVIPPEYEWIVRRLRLLNPFGEYVFETNGKRMTTHGVRSRLKVICKKLGIYYKSPHKIRKTYASILMDYKVDSKMVTDQMGHSSISCTEVHYHRNRKTIDKKTAILGSIPEFQMPN